MYLKRQTTDGEVGVLLLKIQEYPATCLNQAMQAGFLKCWRRCGARRSSAHPAVAYLTRAQRLSAGVVISASHNPFYDNAALNFFSSQGTKLPDDIELQIEKRWTAGMPA